MSYTALLYEKTGRIAVVTINRPKARNAWSDQLNKDMVGVFAEMEADPDILVTILTGNQAGKAFSAGADIANPKTHSTQSVGEELARITPRGMDVFNAVADFPKPVICAINGYALGVAFQVALCCDILIASENAEMGLPQVSLGILPIYGGAVRLARFVGRGNAMRMVLTAERITAQEAYRIGLVSQVVPLPELMPTTINLARKIAALPPLSIRLAKESLNMGLDISSVKQAAQADLYRFLALTLTEDKEESHRAWREKRPPVIRGR